MRVRKGKTKTILKAISKAGVLVILVGTSPYAPSIIARNLFKSLNKKIQKKYSRYIREAQKRKLINIKYIANGKAEITLSHKGKTLLRRYDFDEMRLKKPTDWDGQWRIVIYDIPSSLQRASRALSRKLHNFGIYQLQKSIWVSPYECLPEIEFICTILGLSVDDHFYYFVTKTPPHQKELNKFFKLKNPNT